MSQPAAKQENVVAATDILVIINPKCGRRNCIDPVDLPAGTVVMAGTAFMGEGD